MLLDFPRRWRTASCRHIAAVACACTRTCTLAYNHCTLGVRRGWSAWTSVTYTHHTTRTCASERASMMTVVAGGGRTGERPAVRPLLRAVVRSFVWSLVRTLPGSVVVAFVRSRGRWCSSFGHSFVCSFVESVGASACMCLVSTV